MTGDPFATDGATITSIQGEQQAPEHHSPVLMDRFDVDAEVAKMSAKKKICRERGRHTYPPTSGNMVFVGYDEVWSCFVSEDDCQVCGPLAFRKTWWEPFKIRGVAGVRFRPLKNVTSYRRDPETGELYLADSGQGRMSPKQVRETLVTQVFGRRDQRRLRKDAMDAGQARKARRTGSRDSADSLGA